jgi:hypothetical protein
MRCGLVQTFARGARVRNLDRAIEGFDEQRGAFAKQAVVVDEQDMDCVPPSELSLDNT